jgi:hypothetical protein
VAALPSKSATLRSQTIVSGEDDCTTAHQFRQAIRLRRQHRPPNGRMPDIEGELDF